MQRAHRDAHTYDAHNYGRIKGHRSKQTGIYQRLCGAEDQACEDKIKEELAVTSRCIPFHDQEQISGTCVCCGRAGARRWYTGARHIKEKCVDKNAKISLPAKVARILNTLGEHGYEAYAVGGCVRDSLLGRTPQ